MAFTSSASQYIYLNGQLLSASGGVIYINGVQIPTGFASSTIPADVVRTSGTQTIGGDKTFSNQIISNSIRAAGNDSFISLADNALIGPFGTPSLNWGQYYLVDTDENPSLTWGDGVAIYGSSLDSIATPVVDFTSGQRVFWDGEGIKAADLGSYFFDDGDTLYLRRLYNVAGELTVDWANGVRIFKEGGGILADFVATNGPRFYDSSTTLSLDVGIKSLVGVWSVGGNPISSSGIVNKGYLDNIAVLKTGDQVIDGNKTFSALTKVYQIGNQFNSNLIDVEAGSFTGPWTTDFIPSDSGHIVNKGYLDTYGPSFGSLGGALPDSGKLAVFDKHGQIDINSTPFADLHWGVDKRISAKTASTGNKLIFSTMDHSTPNYVRNVNCWAYGVDLTPMAVYSTAGLTEKGGILVSPRHILFAHHHPIASDSTIRFVDNNNNLVSRVVQSTGFIAGTDIGIGLLDSEVPSTISFAKILPKSLASGFNFSGAPMLATDQEKKAFVQELTSNLLSNNLDLKLSSDSQRSGFFEAGVGGDSGSPISFVWGNQLLLGTFFQSAGATTSSGPSFIRRIDEINSGMAALGGGYTLTQLDSSEFYPLSAKSLYPNLGSSAYYQAEFLGVEGQVPLIGSGNKLSSSILPTLSVEATGLNLVYNTGNQTISGIKTFRNDTNFSGRVNLPRMGIMPGGVVSEHFYIDQDRLSWQAEGNHKFDIAFIDSNGQPQTGLALTWYDAGNDADRKALYITTDNSYLYDASVVVAVDWRNRLLSGNWQTNTTPTLDTHLVNKSYIDNLSFNTQNSGYTLALTDNGKLIEFTGNTAGLLTVPNSTSINFPTGAQILGLQYGTGVISITGASGVSIRSRGGQYRTNGQYAEFSLIKRAANEWLLAGDLVL